MSPETVERTLDRLTAGDGLPPRERLPRYVAPLPAWLENLGLSLVPLVVGINLVGTAFGFWYYRFQFAVAPPAVWPLVPDSPMATLFAALAFGLWWLDRENDYVSALAFFGCWKLGLWTPFVLAAFAPGFLAFTPIPMYAFLFCSHLAMVVQAFVLYRISDFRLPAIGVAAAWYGLNDLVDYFVPLVGTPHHTVLPGQAVGPTGFTHPSPTHEIAAASAVVLTILGLALALETRAAKRRATER